MDVVKVTAKMLARIPAGTRPRTCPACDNEVREGQWVLRDRLASVDFADGLRMIHVNPCLHELVDGVPGDDAPPTTLEQQLHQQRLDHAAALAS